MIIIKLKGGLGNQMFQYAAGRSLSHLHDTALKLDLSWFGSDPKGAYTPRRFELGIFKLDFNFASRDEIDQFEKKAGSRALRVLSRNAPALFSSIYFAESGHDFHKEFFKLPSDACLDGYWQSERYFEGIAETIRGDFTFRTSPGPENKALLEKIKNSDSVSLHIRRADYVALASVNQFHGTCSPGYYRSAVDILKNENKTLELFVFSDDIEWCKEHLPWKENITFISHNTGDDSFEDLRLMMHCRYNIIANSSFSWWAAWLNMNPRKKVIAPKNWFADPSINTKDIYPAKWIKI